MCCNIVLGVLSAGVCGADLMHTLWEADVAVFKAHITTGPGGKVLDMFWIYDNRSELPENHRCLRQAWARSTWARVADTLWGAIFLKGSICAQRPMLRLVKSLSACWTDMASHG